MPKNPLIISSSKNNSNFSRPENQSAGILDDFAVRKNIATKEGTIEKVPINNSDIANKLYVDTTAFSGSQTPWLANIDADTFNLSDVGNIILTTGGKIKPISNSTTALNIAQADGTNFVTFDTTNKKLISQKIDITGGTGTTGTITSVGPPIAGDGDCWRVPNSGGLQVNGGLGSSIIFFNTTSNYLLRLLNYTPTWTDSVTSGFFQFGLANAMLTNVNGTTLTRFGICSTGISISNGQYNSIHIPAAQMHQDSGNATATYHKFTAGTTTGLLSTDGFDVGIDASGNAELRQRENLPMYFYTNNALALTIAADKSATFASKIRSTHATESIKGTETTTNAYGILGYNNGGIGYGGYFSVEGGTYAIYSNGDATFNGNIGIIGGKNINLDSTTGTMIGTGINEKLAFYGKTPVNQPDTIADPAGGLIVDAEARTAINTLIDRLQELGLIA